MLGNTQRRCDFFFLREELLQSARISIHMAVLTRVDSSPSCRMFIGKGMVRTQAEASDSEITCRHFQDRDGLSICEGA